MEYMYIYICVQKYFEYICIYITSISSSRYDGVQLKLRLKDQLKVIMGTMQKYYKDLTSKQSESIMGNCDRLLRLCRSPASSNNCHDRAYKVLQ